ncbi:MAG: site-specific integrase, partial [Acidobacteriota bacterium]|nr:site-specific integrase [Acidobacteriota bacterium]
MAEPSSSRPLLDQFLAYLQFERGLAANTLLSYRRELEKFFSFLRRKRLDCLRLDEKNILDFIRHEGEKR